MQGKKEFLRRQRQSSTFPYGSRVKKTEPTQSIGAQQEAAGHGGVLIERKGRRSPNRSARSMRRSTYSRRRRYRVVGQEELVGPQPAAAKQQQSASGRASTLLLRHSVSLK